jgi:hypothetical protein
MCWGILNDGSVREWQKTLDLCGQEFCKLRVRPWTLPGCPSRLSVSLHLTVTFERGNVAPAGPGKRFSSLPEQIAYVPHPCLHCCIRAM